MRPPNHDLMTAAHGPVLHSPMAYPSPGLHRGYAPYRGTPLAAAVAPLQHQLDNFPNDCLFFILIKRCYKNSQKI